MLPFSTRTGMWQWGRAAREDNLRIAKELKRDLVNKPEASSSQAEIILPQTRVSSVLWLWRCFFLTSHSIAWNKRNIWVKRKHEESNSSVWKKCLCHHPTSNSWSSRRDCDAYDLKVGDWKGSMDLGMTPLIPEQVFRRWSVSILKQKNGVRNTEAL